MKRKKGFTLIELLAVIVILAIIALITVPVVIKIINNAKKGAAEDSAYGVIESAKLFWASKQNDFGKNYATVEFGCTNAKVCSVTSPAELTGTLDISGTKPTGGVITISNGNVSITDLEFGEYKCNTNADYKVTCSISGSSSNNNEPAGPTYTAYSAGDVVYFNPIDGGDTNSCSNVTGNCMKFNVITTNDTTSKDTITLQLDHNIVNNVEWITKADYNDDEEWENNYEGNNKGALTANAALATAVSSWNNVETIKNELNEDVKARMITKDEIIALPDTTVDGSLIDLPDWMVQNIGFDFVGMNQYDRPYYVKRNTYSNEYPVAYWTASADTREYYKQYAYLVNYQGYSGPEYVDSTFNEMFDYMCSDPNCDNGYSTEGQYYGVRPVITVQKSKLN